MAEDGVTRRLAAVLAADVAGYTRLMEADEAGTVTAWRSARIDVIDPMVAEHGGRIVKLTGDGFLAEFSTVQDAVRCAVQMQTELGRRNADQPAVRRMTVRMGVNLGDIFVDADDIYGAGVNIAARLEGLAESGGICISGSVFDQVEGKLGAIGFRFLGNKQVKNVTKPVRAYAVSFDGSDDATTPGSATAGGEPPVRQRVRPAVWAVGIGLVAILIVSVLLPGRGPPQGEGVANSVSVLSFRSIGGDERQQSFSDGLTQDLITTLTESTGLKVVSAGAEAAGSGKAATIQQIGRRLDTRYVLDGSVHGAGNRVRINASLVDTATGYHLWAGRYDRIMDDVLALQDEVTGRIAETLSARLAEAEAERRELEITRDEIAGPLLVKSLRTIGELFTNVVAIPQDMWEWLTGGKPV